MAVDRAGNTNMFSGMSSWKVGDRRKSTSISAASRFGVPARIPANSTWRKQVSVTTPVGGVSTGGSA